MQYQIEIPSVFAFDHTMHRDIWGGDLIKEGKHLWTFRCNEDELAEWIDDAEFYSNRNHWKGAMSSEEYADLLPIIKSAERPLKRLKTDFPERSLVGYKKISVPHLL